MKFGIFGRNKNKDTHGGNMPAASEGFSIAPKLQVHFNVHEPIELGLLMDSFGAIAAEYSDHLKANHLNDDTDSSSRLNPDNINDVKLYLSDIKHNCVLADVVPAMVCLGHVDPVASVLQLKHFVGRIKETFDMFRDMGIATATNDTIASTTKHVIGYMKERQLTKRHARSMESITSLVASADKGEFGLSALRSKGETHEIELEFRAPAGDVRLANLGAKRCIEALAVEGDADFYNEVLYLDTVGFKEAKDKGRTRNRGRISSITSKDLPVLFVRNTDQERVASISMQPGHNPLLTGYVVDVSVALNPQGKPSAYRVLAVHETIGDEEYSGRELEQLSRAADPSAPYLVVKKDDDDEEEMS